MNEFEILMKLIGTVTPVGETHTDEKRFENLKVLCEVSESISLLLHDVAQYKERQEHSMKEMGIYAYNHLKQTKIDIMDKKEIKEILLKQYTLTDEQVIKLTNQYLLLKDNIKLPENHTIHDLMKVINGFEDFEKSKKKQSEKSDKPTAYEKNNLPIQIRHAYCEAVEIYQHILNYEQGIIKKDEFINEVLTTKKKH